MVPKADSGAFLLLFLLVLTVTEPLRPELRCNPGQFACHGGTIQCIPLCERPQGCQQYRKDPKECCKFMCLDPDGSSLFDSMASGMRLVVSCISSFLILSLLLFMVHRLRQRRRERIESLIGANLHHFNLGRRIPGFDYGPDGFGTGLTPLHLWMGLLTAFSPLGASHQPV